MEELNLRGERSIQAVRWITKIDSDDMTPCGWSEFLAWILNNRENRATFMEIHERWNRQLPPAEVVPLFPHRLGKQK
jgi:ferric-dicitrate binding protein FerR (iron transport regulator)